MAYTFRHGDRPLDRLTVQRAVGRGGFGEVYYAVYDSGKQVAMKYLRENPEVELRGISQVMNLKSPHLITIYDVLRNEENEPFVIMEYVSGPSLRELITAEPDGMGAQKAAFFVQGIASGLAYLHDRGIVHRDLKPGNIFYDDGYVKIGDYGLSKHIAMSAHSGNTVSVGTVHYMAPEIGSGSYSKAIDIYALGVILYELLTGRLPYTGSSMGEILMRHLNDRPDLVGIPDPFRGVIAKALAKDPKERYQDANEMVDALTSVAEISESIATFNPATLANAERFPEASDAQTQTARGGRRQPVAPLDARAGGDAFPAIPPIPPVPGDLSKEQQGKGKKKCNERVTAQIMMMGMLAVAMGLVIGLTTGERMPEAGIALVFMLVGGVAGTLFAHIKLLQYLPMRNWFMERLVYASTAGVAMLPGVALAAEEVRDNDFAPIFLPILASLLLCDFHQRIERGRDRRVEAGQAFMPAIVGLIGAAIFTEGDYTLHGAALVAAFTVLLSMTASIFHRKPGEDMRLVQKAADYDRPRTPPAVPPHVARRQRARDPQPVAPTAPSAPAEPAPAKETKPQPPAPQSLDQPSFVGRAANAGLAFVAKTLIVLGLVWAICFQMRVTVPGPDGRPAGHVGLSSVQIIEGDHYAANFTIPRWAVMIPFAIGLFTLITARRADSAWHFLRGIIGCAFGMVAAGIAVGPAAEPLSLILQDKFELLHEMHRGPLVNLVIVAVVSITLIFWPKKNPRRPIVI